MLFSLLCSLSWIVIQEVWNTHLLSTTFNAFNNASDANISHIIYGHQSHNDHQYNEIIKRNNSLTCACVGIEKLNMIDVGKYIDMIMHSYLDDDDDDGVAFTNHEWYKDLKYTCTLYDSNSQLLYMISDSIGSSPLWYSFPTKELDSTLNFMVTTDLILANRLGFEFLTPLGPGQVIAVDLRANEIVQLHQWQSDQSQRSNYDDLRNAKMYAYRLIASSMNALSDYHGLDEGNTDIEVDPLNPSSLLLDCAMSALDMNYHTHIAQAVVSDSIIPDSARFARIMKDASDPRNLMTHVWAPKFTRVAADRWNFCANSVSKTIVSHDSGMFSRPLDVYLQNLFCASLGVRILYPFRSLDFQLKLWGTGYPHSYFNNALDVLREPFSCKNYESRTYSSEYSNVTNVNGSRNKSRSTLGDLWQVGNKYASHDKYLVLVLATSGYADLLQNFLCSTSKLNSKHIVVLTPNEDIAEIAKATGIGFVITSSWQNTNINLTIADFGTLSYQELILFRTETVMNLLLLGFNPIIADIDAVWLQDPLEILRIEHRMQNFDVAVTNDRGEICGCFISLQNTKNSLMFWKEVSRLHRELIIRGRNLPEYAREFSESEQKILTNLLLHKGYDKQLFVIVLSGTDFPSGFDFFNLRSSINDETIGQPAVVHNNYIIGKGVKKIRFARYNLWSVGPSTVTLRCDYNPLLEWDLIADKVEKNIKIPMLSLILPVHNSMISTSLLMAQAHTESSEFNVSSGRFWLETNPPNFIEFNTLGVYQLEVKKSDNINCLSVILDKTSISISADVGVNRTVFSFDRNGKAHEAANENVLKTKRAYSNPRIEHLKCEICDTVKLRSLEYDESGQPGTAVNSFRLNYTIKVLAYNRPASLSRLLQSLADADYLGLSIPLEIFVDYASREEDIELVNGSREVATKFQWTHGSKELTFRDTNYGLAQQWFSAWSPTSSNEVAFIFEDDLQVSPLFFVWSYRALFKYYVDDEHQRIKQMMLLEAVKRHIGNGGVSSDTSDEFPSTIEEFVTMTAGDPIMYGICLQRQHLDPARYPKELEIRNRYRPFLYSLIGSWGPLLLPLPWLAFREWWEWKWNNKFDPKTENIVVNHFHDNNPRIWTPWMVRFAFETGVKCLYPNLPGDLSFVSNHREIGENYKHTLGPESKLLLRDDVDRVRRLTESDEFKASSIRFRFIATTAVDRFLVALHQSINYLPPLASLAEWQFDLNLRRAGSMASDKLLTSVVNDVNNKEFQVADKQITDAKVWYEISAAERNENLILMSKEHWVEVVSLLEANLFVDASFAHLGLSPLVRLLVNRYHLHVIASNEDFQKQKFDVGERLRWTTIDSSNFPTDAFDIAVVHLPGLMNDSFKRFLKESTFEYLLILSNSCSGSPTDLHFEGVEARSYSLVEDVCAEADIDVGASLFRQILNGTEEEWHSERYMVSRRIKTRAEILVTRRSLNKSPTFV